MSYGDSNSELVADDKKTQVNAVLIEKPKDISTPEGMVWVKGKIFIQGAKQGDQFALPREIPAHQVTVDGFFIDITEVTNKQFKAFVDATAYKTVAERAVGEARILGVVNGDPSSHEADNCLDGNWKRSLFNGKCQIILQSPEKEGEFALTASSEGLKSATATIIIKKIRE